MKQISGLPGLEGNTYTFVQLDDTLTTAGKAADAKKTGDELNNLKSAFNRKTRFVLQNLIDVSSVLVDKKTSNTQMTEAGVVTVSSSTNIITNTPIALPPGTYYIRASKTGSGNVLTWDKDLAETCGYPVGCTTIAMSSEGTTRTNEDGIDIWEYTLTRDYEFWFVINAQKSSGAYTKTLMVSDCNFLGSDIVVPYNKTAFINTTLQEQVAKNAEDIADLETATAPLYGKRIAYFGDSLMAGLELNGNGFVSDVVGGIWKRLNDKYDLTMVANQSVGGSSIQRVGNDNDSIAYKISQFDFSNTDICLFTGGFNDAYHHIRGDSGYTIGEVPVAYNTSLDWSTMVSSLDSAFHWALRTNPKLKIIWIKTWKTSGYKWVTDKTAIDASFNAIEKVCNKYAVPVCDVFNNSNLFLAVPVMQNAFGRHNYTSASEYEIDGTHINSDAYDKVTEYVDAFINHILSDGYSGE
jgi:lysophospholipase L1-like esterase